jgi:cytoplasmic iron level regulating protein YaaA (DUF328/UPF0246 family)
MKVCRELTPAQIGSLMKISDKLSGLNAARFSEWSQPFTINNAKQAALAFNGDVYGGLEASTLTASDLDYAQSHLRILSGLYGLLKPLDLMQAYRLEMGTKLENSRGKNLYEFWGSIIADKLNEVTKAQDAQYLVNLASNEYFKAVDKKALNAQIITPQFKDCKNGQYKVISFYAKKARGMMARYIIENQVTQLSQLKEFTVDGYYYSAEATAKELEPVFLRDERN